MITSNLMSPLATPTASEPSETTIHRQPIRVIIVSSILADIGLSSAIKTVTARSCDDAAELRL